MQKPGGSNNDKGLVEFSFALLSFVAFALCAVVDLAGLFLFVVVGSKQPYSTRLQ